MINDLVAFRNLVTEQTTHITHAHARHGDRVAIRKLNRDWRTSHARFLQIFIQHQKFRIFERVVSTTRSLLGER